MPAGTTQELLTYWERYVSYQHFGCTGGFAEVTEAIKENIATETGNLQEEHDRIAAEKAAEEARMAEVKLKEEERIAAEKAAVEEEAK
jgi:hypothetical protein